MVDKRYNTRKSKGLCVACGVNPLYTKTRCLRCARKMARNQRRRYRGVSIYQQFTFNVNSE